MAALDKVRAETAEKHRGVEKAAVDEMSEYAKQAARNMQSSFSDYLFSPFADGTRDMGDKFSETIRRMLAESASAKFFELIGTWASRYSGAGTGWINANGG